MKAILVSLMVLGSISVVALPAGGSAMSKPGAPTPEGAFVDNANATPYRAAAETRTCGTSDVAEIDADQIQLSLDQFNSVRGAAQIKSSGTISIPVYFHVINQGPGLENGDVPT